jgi:hypothetical protein
LSQARWVVEHAGGAIELDGVKEADLELVVELVGELADYEQRRHEVLVDSADLG